QAAAPNPARAVPEKSSSPAPQEAAPGSLSGRVVGADGQPLAGARVWFDSFGDQPVAETRTDADGRYKLGPLPSSKRGLRCLLVEADGLPRQYVQQPTVFPGADHALGDILVPPGKRLQGQVLDVDARPLAGATVYVTLSRYVLGHSLTNVGPSYEVR